VTLRLGLVGGGWISRRHLEALERLGRTKLVGVVSRTAETGDTITARWGGARYDELDAMLARTKPDVAYVAVPPNRAVAIGERLLHAGIPFLTEKPLAASDAAGPERLSAAIERAGLIVAVGYHLRALDILTEVRAWLAGSSPQLVVARWLDSTPGAPWWGKTDQGGGQVIEQATHLYDLARLLMGEATVVGAASTRDILASPRGVNVADSTAAVLRFEDGGVGSFANTRRLASATIEMEFISEGFITTLTKRPERGQGDWHANYDDGTAIRSIRSGTDPYENQAAAFLDAVETGDASHVLSTYADALRTDRLTRAVVAATGAPG
jgi:myo-inositol 2-dehydrogenase / D-chiro-inositol 1-dehydrogenase